MPTLETSDLVMAHINLKNQAIISNKMTGDMESRQELSLCLLKSAFMCFDKTAA